MRAFRINRTICGATIRVIVALTVAFLDRASHTFDKPIAHAHPRAANGFLYLSREQDYNDREGLVLPPIQSPKPGSIKEYRGGAQQVSSPLQRGLKPPRRAGLPKAEAELPSGLFDGYVESTPYDFSNLGELIYLQKGKSPLVQWTSLNDELNNVLKAQYTPEGGGVAISAPPYTQGPATLPPQRLKLIDSAEQLVFSLGLREGNRIIPKIRKLDVSGHQLPSIPDQIGHIAALTSLNFSGNRLQVHAPTRTCVSMRTRTLLSHAGSITGCICTTS